MQITTQVELVSQGSNYGIKSHASWKLQQLKAKAVSNRAYTQFRIEEGFRMGLNGFRMGLGRVWDGFRMG